MTPGIVYLVGAGPGDPELLTIKARRVLGAADAVVYDHLVAPEVLELAGPGCERVFAGKKGGEFSRPQSEIDETLVRLALEGKTVVRLKGGDPFIFGRGVRRPRRSPPPGLHSRLCRESRRPSRLRPTRGFRSRTGCSAPPSYC
jgi:siroheme synthase